MVCKNSAVFPLPCGGCCQWCPGGAKHSDRGFAGQDDVNAAMVNAWQMSSLCNFLIAGPSCSTEPSISRKVDLQGRTEIWVRYHEGQYSRAATGQRNVRTHVSVAMVPMEVQKLGKNGARKVQLTGPQQRSVDTTLRRLQARQTNFTQDSIDALHRRIAFRAYCLISTWRKSKRAGAAVTGAYAPSGATDTCP